MKKQPFVFLFLFGLVSVLYGEPKFEEVKRKVSTVLPSINGWCSQEKAMNFIDLVMEVKPKVCVEIGVFGGSSLFPVACALRSLGEGVVYAIDPWDKFECIKYYDPIKDKANLQWWASIDLEYVYNEYLNLLKRFGIGSYCVTIRTNSARAVDVVNNIDILHIDGNHSEISFLQDVTLYLPKVRPGGYIWLNDALWDDAQLASDFLLDHCEVIKLIDDGNCILFQKR